MVKLRTELDENKHSAVRLVLYFLYSTRGYALTYT